MTLTSINKKTNQDVIDLLAGLLEKAKSDEMDGFTCIYDMGGAWHSTWSGSQDLTKLIAQLEIMKHRQIIRFLENE